jgi:type IV pilus assembly protein PilM
MTGFLHRRSLIGIDVDGRGVKAVQLEGSARHPRLAAAMFMPRSDPTTLITSAEAECLAGALARQGFEGGRIALAVPDEKLVTGMLELPPRHSGAPLEDIARAELATMHGYDPQTAEAVSWDLPPSSRVKDATQAMAVACRHTDADALLALFDYAGLEVAVLESRLHALVRGCGPLLAGESLRAVLDLEWNASTLLLWYQDSVIYRWTMAQAGLRHLASSLATALGLDEPQIDCLLTDIGLTGPAGGDRAPYEEAGLVIRKHLDAAVAAMKSPLSYAGQQYPEATVGGLWLTGPGASIPGVADYMKLRLEMQAQVATPAQVLTCTEAMSAKAQDPSLLTAIGLAQASE